MAITTYNTTLTWGLTEGATTYTVEIKDFPDLTGDPNLVPATTLSDAVEAFEMGIKTAGAMPFTCNYDKTQYSAIEGASGTAYHYTLHFGTDGVNGKFGWQGKHSVKVPGKGIDDLVEMILIVVPATEPKLIN